MVCLRHVFMEVATNRWRNGMSKARGSDLPRPIFHRLHTEPEGWLESSMARRCSPPDSRGPCPARDDWGEVCLYWHEGAD